MQKPIRAAGFTEAAYKECLRNGLADYAPWKSSRIVLSVNPLRTGLNQGPGDPEFTEQIMRDCRKTLGARCVLDNHDLDTDLARPPVRIYALMKRLGPEIVFQTAKTNPPDFEGTIKMGSGAGCDVDQAVAGLQGLSARPRRATEAVGGDDRGEQDALTHSYRRLCAGSAPPAGAQS